MFLRFGKTKTFTDINYIHDPVIRYFFIFVNRARDRDPPPLPPLYDPLNEYRENACRDEKETG